ncbi:MAG: histidine phosphatase family protein [Frankiales bacterium]|nr:histidine phosphatase family protein [Frankiales bacterium]
MAETTGRILVLRHGETEWSRERRHTGRTDLPLTPEGEAAARAAGERLAGWRGAVVLCSPLQRARRTAELAGLAATVDDDLVEWDYGAAEGRTTAEMRREVPGWTVWTAGAELGESIDEVARRAARVLDRCRPVLAGGRDVVLVAHAHLLRILAVTWIEQPPTTAAHLVLGATGTGVLADDLGIPVLESWNP